MSEMTPERQAPRRENVFTRRIGPLPMWVWVAIIGGGIAVWALYRRRTAGTTTPTPTGMDASQVPPFVNQTYMTVTPPVAGPPGPQGPPGPVRYPPPGPRVPRTLYGPPVRTERLRYRGNLEQIAKRNGIDLEDLLEANPELRKYKGTRHIIPPGTEIKIPAAAT